MSDAELARQRAHFAERAAYYRRLGHDRHLAAAFVVDCGGLVGGRGLDVGTGKGLLAIALARAGLEVISIDVDRAEQRLARLLASEAGVDGQLALTRASADQLPFADASFDGVAMMDVLHHLQDPAPALAEMARVLAPGGRLIVADFDDEGFALVARVHREEGREHPRSQASVDAAMTALEARGLRLVTRRRGHLQDVAVLERPWREG